MAVTQNASLKASTIDAGMCERLIGKALETCHRTPATVPGATTGDGLAGLGVAISLATLALALITLAGAIGWLFYVRHRTKIAAKEEAEKVVPTEVRAYLDERIPGMVAEAVAALATQGSTGGVSAEDQARDLGGEPGKSS